MDYCNDTKWVPNLDDRGGALYRTIAEALADDVAAGRLAPGTKLPTHRALAERLGVTVGTVTRAYAEAERRGLVEATVGRGTFVRQAAVRLDPTWPTPPRGGFMSLHQADKPAPSRPGNPAETGTGAGGTAPLAELSANYPVSSYLGAALRPGLERMLNTDRLSAVAGYAPGHGHPDHRAAGARWLQTFGLDADPAEIVVTPGAQGALNVTLGALARHGDTLLVEELTWPGMHLLAQRQGLRLVPVAMDDDGLRPDALAEAARRSGARVAYCMPTLHNPTNATMPLQRRREIMAVAAAEGLTVIEDDVYGFLSEKARTPLSAIDRAHAVHVTSLSKSVAPGLRIGFVRAPRRLVQGIAAAMRATDLMASSIAAELAAQLIASGDAGAAAARQREAARERQALAAAALSAAETMTAPTSFHVWLRLPEPWTAASFARHALARGIAVTQGDVFTADGHDPQAVRLCLCAVPDTAALGRALAEVADLAAGQPESSLPVV